MRRRHFIQRMAAIAGTGVLLQNCANTTKKKIPGAIIGAAAAAGHKLRDQKIQGTPQTNTHTGVVIVGAGVSGLSAARQLHQNGITDFIVLDLEDHTGGNASCGVNAVSAYPWGAHYVPVPNNDLTDYLSFLKDCGVVTGYNEQGLPVYNEYYLCFAPEERLYINGSWQDGLVPKNGVPADQLQQVQRFLQQVDQLRTAKGRDGKDAFAIPVNNSSTDEQFVQWDNITMKDWLNQQGYTAEYLHWYCNYCCRDDFGTRYNEISAWAGIHYFAARKGKAANAEHQDVLTWPAGNGWLVTQLQKDFIGNIKLKSLVTAVRETADGVEVIYMDVTTGQLHSITATQCIMAIPQFVALRLLSPDENRLALVNRHFSYAPWMVANLTVGALEERNGRDLSWDNVLYNSESLGYVEATHQSLQQKVPEKVLTYYMPLTQSDPVTARKQAMARTHEDWVGMILQDLQKVHENIATAVSNIDINLWGHGMIRPIPQFIHGEARKLLSKPINQSIYFAHTDLAGISIFEEAFYQGLQAANTIIKQQDDKA